MLPKQRVQPHLRQVRERARTGLAIAGLIWTPAARVEFADLLAATHVRSSEGGVPSDAMPAILRWRTGGGIHGHPQIVKDLHGPNVQQVSAWKVSLEVSTLEQQEVDPGTLEE